MAQRPQPSLRFADGGSFITRWAQNVMRPNNTANRLRQVEAPPPAPAPAPPPPPPPNPNATPDNPAGIRFQDGGVVPGTGRGDKIPAKYEPGEFVVSNDMIDDNPGLREQLATLRAETLAARGKTVEEADAKALRYHGGLRGGAYGQETRNEELQAAHAGGRDLQRMDGQGGDVLHRRGGAPQGVRNAQVSLRANAGFGGSADPDFWRGNPNPLQGNQANQTLLDAARQRIDPVQTAARNAAAAPTAPAMDPPANPGMANPQAQAAYDDMARARAQPTAPTVEPAAPKPPGAGSKWLGSADDWKNFAKGPADSPHKTLRMAAPSAPTGLAKAGGAVQGLAGAYNAYEGLQEGDAWKAGVGAADAVAGAALFTPAAPIAGAYLGLRGAYDTAKMAGGAIYDHVLSDKAKDVIGGTFNQIGLNTGLWGEDGSAKLMADAQARLANPAGTPRTTTPSAAPADDRNPYAATNAAKIAAADAQNKAAPPVAAPATPPGYTNNVVRNGNSYEGTNVRGDITINGFAPGAGLNLGSGPNAQNMAAANNLAGGDTLRSQGAALGVQPAGGSGIPAMAPTLHSGNSWEARNNLRNLEVSASSIYNSRSHWGNKAKAAADAAAFQNAQAMDTAARTGSDPGSVARTNAQASMFGSKTAADASRENSRNSLRGTMYTADSQLGAKQLEMQQKLRQQAMMGSIYEAAGGDPVKAAKLAASYGLDSKSFQDMAAADQTRGFNASKNASSRLESLAVVRNDKGEEVVSPGRLARVNSMVTKMAPNFSQMDEESQTKVLRQVEAGVNLLEGINDRRNNGFLQMIGWDGDSPSLDNLPDMQGGKLKTVGALEGATTVGGVARKDYVIEVGGHKLYLPRPKINQGELELLKARGVDISGIDK